MFGFVIFGHQYANVISRLHPSNLTTKTASWCLLIIVWLVLRPNLGCMNSKIIHTIASVRNTYHIADRILWPDIDIVGRTGLKSGSWSCHHSCLLHHLLNANLWTLLVINKQVTVTYTTLLLRSLFKVFLHSDMQSLRCTMAEWSKTTEFIMTFVTSTDSNSTCDLRGETCKAMR